MISLGTSGTAFAYSSRAIVDPRGDIAAFCDSTGAYLPLLCTNVARGETPCEPNLENHRVYVEMLRRFEMETRRL